MAQQNANIMINNHMEENYEEMGMSLFDAAKKAAKYGSIAKTIVSTLKGSGDTTKAALAALQKFAKENKLKKKDLQQAWKMIKDLLKKFGGADIAGDVIDSITSGLSTMSLMEQPMLKF